MATSDASKYHNSVDKLNSLIEFTSEYSSNPDRVIYDTVLIDDPFKKKEIQKLVPEKHRERVVKLVESFERSLETLSVSNILFLDCLMVLLTLSDLSIHIEGNHPSEL